MSIPLQRPRDDSSFRSETHSERSAFKSLTKSTGFRIAACLSAAIVLAGFFGITANPPGDSDLLTIQRAPFRVDLTCHGSLEPLRTERVVSQCQWTVRILSLVPEGTWVRKGDIVCVLDSSEIEEFRRSREVSLIKAEAALESSRQQQELLKASNERRQSDAEQSLASAQFDLLEYTNGMHPNDLQKLDDEISINQDRLQSADSDLQFAERMWMMGYSNRATVEVESLKVTTQSEQVRRLEFQKSLLQQFGHPRQEVRMKHQLNNSRLNVLRTELANSVADSRAKLMTLANEHRLTIYERYAKAAGDSITACTLRAPRDGQVMHCNNWQLQSRGIITIAEGKSVYFSQPVFEIPDQERLKILLPVNEALITSVGLGSKVTIRPVGFEDQEIPAEVIHVSPYPVVRDRYAPEVKEYFLNAVLKPHADQQKIVHPRMEAEGTLTLMDKKDAISIPSTAIAKCFGQSLVLIKNGDQLLPCLIRAGEAVEGKVLIESGLSEGDQIVSAISDQQRDELEAKLGSGKHRTL